MADPTTLKLIDEVSKRIDILEKEISNDLGPSFWIPILISAFAVGLSLFSYFSNKKQTKKNALSKIKSNIDIAKSQIETLTMEFAPLKAKKNKTADEKREFGLKRQVLDTVIERLLNGYEDGCDKYYKNQLLKQDFVDTYHQDISAYIIAFPDKFSEPLTRFTNMLKYYNEYHKNVKA